jgi:stage V sporulation protein R
VGFIDAFLTPEFAHKHNFFTCKYNPRTKEYVIDSRDFEAIKRQLLFGLTNFGQPIVVVQDANYSNRSELLLYHEHEGIDLKLDWAEDTLENLHAVWTRPVYLQTVVDGKPTMFSFDGSKHAKKKL